MNKIISYLAIVVLSVAGFSAAAKETSTTPQKTLAQVEAKAVELASGIEKVQKQLSELDAQKNERMRVEIERDRKSIEFWLGFLGVITTVIAFGGGFIPYLMGKKANQQLKSDLEDIRKSTETVQADRVFVQKELEEARRLVDSIREHHIVAEKSTTEIAKYKDSISSKEATEVEQQESAIEANEVDIYPLNSDISKLKARAVSASQSKNPSFTQALEAFELWKALSVIDINNDSAQFNAGYWASQLERISAPPSVTHWRSIAKLCYESSLKINPRKHEAANNWGIVLGKDGVDIAKTDLNSAQELWRLAAEKFAIALQIKVDNHEAAYNWGVVLGKEASELAKTNPKAAQTKWKQAGEKYALALNIKADKYEAANNWGIILGKEAAEASKTDLNAAQILWKKAGEKFALALHIEAKNDEAAYNWGVALGMEAALLAKTDLKAAQANWKKAANILQKSTESTTSGEVSYNLACYLSLLEELNESQNQLEIARLNDGLPTHWREDSDLENLRQTDEYKTWYKTHFGDDKT